MSKTTLRHLIISTVALLLAVGVLVYAVFRISNEGESLKKQVDVLQKEQAHQNSYYKLQKTAEDSLPSRTALETYFLKQSADSIDFLNQIEALAPTMGVVLKTDSLEETTDKKTEVKSIDVKVTLTGTRDAVERFIATLEHLPHLSQVMSVNLVSRAGSEWEAKVAIKVFIITYAQ